MDSETLNKYKQEGRVPSETQVTFFYQRRRLGRDGKNTKKEKSKSDSRVF